MSICGLIAGILLFGVEGIERLVYDPKTSRLCKVWLVPIYLIGLGFVWSTYAILSIVGFVIGSISSFGDYIRRRGKHYYDTL